MHHPVTIGIIVAVHHEARVKQGIQPDVDPLGFPAATRTPMAMFGADTLTATG